MSRELWANSEWSVTEFGIEHRGSPEYLIPKGRLAETIGQNKTIGFWPVQVAEKTWADLPMFLKAYTKALELHSPVGRDRIDTQLTLVQAERAAAARTSY